MALITLIRDLHRRKARERRHLALAEGVRLVEEMVATRARCKGAAVAPMLDATPRGAELRAKLLASGVAVEEVSDAELDQLAATEHPQGVVAVYQPRQWKLDDLAPDAGRPLLILDALQDPGNVGTIARTAHAFGAAGVVALPGTADLTHPKVVRGAMGALFRLPHLHADDDVVFEWLQRHDVAVWATAMHGEPIERVAVSGPIAIVLGNEGAGVRDDIVNRAAQTVRIPIHPDAESLNVAVAAGIVLHQVAARTGR